MATQSELVKVAKAPNGAQRLTYKVGPFDVIPAYRWPKTNALWRKTGGGGGAKKSYHMRGKAIDVRVENRRLSDLRKAAPAWINGIVSALRGALVSGMVSASRPGDLPPPGRSAPGMSLVDDDTIETEILSSRLALAMMDRASWEFTDLRSRMSSLEKRDELDTNDVLRPHVLARIVTSTTRRLSVLIRVSERRPLGPSGGKRAISAARSKAVTTAGGFTVMLPGPSHAPFTR